MPVTRTCTFCGNDIEPGTGKMFIRKDGAISFFCSSKCQRNLLDLGRAGRKVRWTRRYVRALQVQAPKRPESATVREEVPEPAEEPEVVASVAEEGLEALTQVPDVGPATAQALVEAGITDVEALRKADLDTLTKVKGIGPAKAKKILEHMSSGD